MSRTVSARIPTELHEDLRERCNNIGESINDFVKAAIEFALYESCNFDFGGDEEEEQDMEPDNEDDTSSSVSDVSNQETDYTDRETETETQSSVCASDIEEENEGLHQARFFLGTNS